MANALNPGLLITDAMLHAAARIDDIDTACAGVQDQVGITEGFVCDMAIGEHRDAWPTVTDDQRLLWLLDWREAEIADGQANEATGAVTPMSPEDYAKNPGVCPACRGTEIEGGSINVDGFTCSQKVSCNACDAEWTDVYHLVGYEDLSGGGQ